ncbi:hypothetical protein BDB00DRAFT_964299 [Zychaea mexicana]|uniref:uncharacterized protein n=1 Tax=Zychaea mexicana TaxID=64656 RepID=UPI0022FE3AA8|nr:uncharacterized protein BDB00DRAFT_964299 [Zychaea mexicana]KAI9488041.1 hypothetical protein BDB00DRAFT_964299 [Zychaea mexicana]
MREPNLSFPSQNRAAVCITSALYDRRALDCTATLPMINSLTHLAYLTSTSPRIREILILDGGLEQLVRILSSPHVQQPMTMATATNAASPHDLRSLCQWSLAFQCVVNIGVRGTEQIRTRVVEAGMITIVLKVLQNFLRALEAAQSPVVRRSTFPYVKISAEQRRRNRRGGATQQHHQHQREQEGSLVNMFYREEDILMSLQLLAYLSKYPHIRQLFYTAYDCNVFSIVERFTHRVHPHLIQYWAGVIMRNACRKDETQGGIRRCANMRCGKWETKPREFAKCRRCRKAKYCSKACQSEAWSDGHRWWCVERPPSSSTAAVVTATVANTEPATNHATVATAQTTTNDTNSTPSNTAITETPAAPAPSISSTSPSADQQQQQQQQQQQELLQPMHH